MDEFVSREAIIASVARESGVDAQLLMDLLALEGEHSNLHAWGARPRLRRAAEALIDEAFKKVRATPR